MIRSSTGSRPETTSGIYSDCKGLDVTHVGIFIKQRKIIISEACLLGTGKTEGGRSGFIEYVKNKPGIVVFRPKL